MFGYPALKFPSALYCTFGYLAWKDSLEVWAEVRLWEAGLENRWEAGLVERWEAGWEERWLEERWEAGDRFEVWFPSSCTNR